MPHEDSTTSTHKSFSHWACFTLTIGIPRTYFNTFTSPRVQMFFLSDPLHFMACFDEECESTFWYYTTDLMRRRYSVLFYWGRFITSYARKNCVHAFLFTKLPELNNSRIRSYRNRNSLLTLLLNMETASLLVGYLDCSFSYRTPSAYLLVMCSVLKHCFYKTLHVLE